MCHGNFILIGGGPAGAVLANRFAFMKSSYGRRNYGILGRRRSGNCYGEALFAIRMLWLFFTGDLLLRILPMRIIEHVSHLLALQMCHNSIPTMNG
jgi:hypothetical protein